MEPQQFVAGHPLGLSVFHRVRSIVDEIGGVDARISKSQVAFRRKHGFAYLWMPGQYLAEPAVDVVLSIPLGRHEQSGRFKQVVHPSPKHWMHHLEVRDVGEIDDQVAAWLREAAGRAG
jgi:hypothetical protein